MLAVAGIARGLGLDRRAAALGAVLFASLPVVVLQASTALNDLALASFLVIVVYFLLRGERMHLGLGALALALAVATKATALLALPVLALLAIGLTPRRRWPGMAVAGAAGIGLGAFWYYVNRAETGSLVPRFAPTNQGGAGASHDPELVKYSAQLGRLVVDAIDPAGFVGRDRYLYVVAAAIVLAIGLAAAVRRRSRGAGIAAIVAAVVVVPAAFVTLHDRLLRGSSESGSTSASPTSRSSAPIATRFRPRRPCPGTARSGCSWCSALWRSPCERSGAGPGLTADICDAGWRALPVGEPGWRLYERVGLCPGETAER